MYIYIYIYICNNSVHMSGIASRRRLLSNDWVFPDTIIIITITIMSDY